MRALAARLGWSEGDVWTVGIGLALALSLAITTVPVALRDRVPLAAREGNGPAPTPPPSPAVGAPVAPVAVPPPPATAPFAPPAGPDAPAGSEGGPPPTSTPTSPPLAPIPPGVVAMLAGIGTGGAPGGLATAADGTVHAGTDAPAPGGGPSALLSWDPRGTLRGRAELPGQPESRTRGATALATAPDGGVVVTDAASPRVLRYDPARRTWSVLAALPDLAPCLVPAASSCQPALIDAPPLPRGVVVSPDGVTYVADAGQGVIWRLQSGRPLEPWYASADVAGPQGLAGLALDRSGALLAVVTRFAGLQADGAGGVLRIERAADGAAGRRTSVAAFPAGADAVDLAPGATGGLHVALRGADAVVVLDAKGSEQLRVVDPALDAPSALALVAGRLYVTTTGPRPAVLQVGTSDRPL